MSVVVEDDFIFLAASRARCTSQFKCPAELRKRGTPVLGLIIAVSKIPITAVTTNLEGGRK